MAMKALRQWLRGLFSAERVDEALGVRVQAEGESVLVRMKDRSELFAGTAPEPFLNDLRAAVAAVRLGPCSAQCGGEPVAFSDEEERALRRDIALHWMRYALSVGQPVRITEEELVHPQTWGIVLRAAERKYGPNSAAAFSLAAEILGFEAERLAQWRRVEEDRVSWL